MSILSLCANVQSRLHSHIFFFSLISLDASVSVLLDDSSTTERCADDVQDEVQRKFHVDVDTSDDIDSDDDHEVTLAIDNQVVRGAGCRDVIREALDLVDDALSERCDRNVGYLRGYSKSRSYRYWPTSRYYRGRRWSRYYRKGG